MNSRTAEGKKILAENTRMHLTIEDVAESSRKRRKRAFRRMF